MKTKNQTEQALLELAVNTAANEEGFPPQDSQVAALDSRNHPWSPYEVWRTRMKTSSDRPADPALI